uniref:Putative RNA-dependent RNA polymerase n=1 Tax=Davidia involucrata TaxID=16924 RepID=A0A5B7BBJ9_DAVIN
MTAYQNLRDYEFTNFSNELEDLNRGHPHVVRRDVETIYRDEFALNAIMDEYPVIYEQELEGWARSFYTQEGHMQAIHAYATQDTPFTAVNEQVYFQAVHAVKNELNSLPIARAFDVLTELDQIKYEQSSAAGYDYIGHKGPILGDNHKRAIYRAKATLWSAIKDPTQGIAYVIENSVPDVGYTRTQLTNLTEKTKVRGVWGRAFHYILLEGTSARPLLDNFIQGDTFFHIGSDPLESVPRILSEVSRQCKWLYAVDWSAFDSSVSRFEIYAAFDLIKGRIQFPNFETEQAFEISKQLFLHKKVAAPDGRTYWSHKGIPSGSYYTSIIGSVINRLRIEYLWRLKYGRGPRMCYTQGDDSLLGDEELFSPEELSNLAQPYGWTINANKTEYSTSPEFVSFLGRTTRGGFNTRELMRCLRLLVFPEYPVESGRISAYRARAIADDCGNLSEIINFTARRLRKLYGIADENDVPSYFIRYAP